MFVTELNRDQLVELKQNYLWKLDECGELEEVTGYDTLCYDVLADADKIVPDDVIFENYNGTTFTDDDFFCIGNKEA